MPDGACILIKGGRVVDPGSCHDAPADVAIAKGMISSHAPDQVSVYQVIDAAGLQIGVRIHVVAPVEHGRVEHVDVAPTLGEGFGGDGGDGYGRQHSNVYKGAHCGRRVIATRAS